VFEWVKGSILAPVLATLDDRQAFEAMLKAEYARAYPSLPDGTTIFPFTRMFIVATR
jgi:trans-aconitate 2-methyltransferase